IWALIPITRPKASNSGPPELPWLIGASTWIASTRLYCEVSDSIERKVAETTPIASEFSLPNGLPIAATGSPTTRRLERVRARVDAQHADVVEHVPPDDLRLHPVAILELDVDAARRAGGAVAVTRRRDHVRVGQDHPVAGGDEARALGDASGRVVDRVDRDDARGAA